MVKFKKIYFEVTKSKELNCLLEAKQKEEIK